MDVRSPSPPRFDFVLLRDLVAELDACTAIEAKVGLFIPGRWTVRIGGDGLVDAGEFGSGGSVLLVAAVGKSTSGDLEGATKGHYCSE